MEISTSRPADDVPAFLGPALAGDPTRPLLTYYDDATGERTELSALTLGNWVAKTANLLVDGCGLGSGDRAAVLLPPHWQTAAVLLGSWSAGLSVDLAGAGPCDVVFVAQDRLDQVAADASFRYVLGLAPMGAPLREVPDGYEDYAREVLAHGDRFRSSGRLSSGRLDAQREAAAREAVSTHGLRGADRVLVDAAVHTDPVQWLLAPLSVGASVVLCAHLDPGAVDDRVRVERVTRVL